VNRFDDEPERLFDPEAPPHEEIAALERALAPLAHRGAPPAWPARAARRRSAGRRWAWTLAALLVVAAGIALLAGSRGGWQVELLEGVTRIDGRPIGDAARLHPGDRLETGDGGRARLAISWLGEVEVEPGSSLRLLSARERDQRMELERGTLHARISAPPRWFTVETRSATAFDLGCAYTITVDGGGDGAIEVVSGWVALAGKGRESFVARGARARLSGARGPGTPLYLDAPDALATAVDRLDALPVDAPDRVDWLATALAAARPRDAMTVWHLLASARNRDERERIAARLDALAAPPPVLDREELLAGDREALDTRWSSLGLGSADFWRIWRQPWPPPAP
jgi:hypothetical protein